MRDDARIAPTGDLRAAHRGGALDKEAFSAQASVTPAETFEDMLESTSDPIVSSA